jgi:hypothetical protein
VPDGGGEGEDALQDADGDAVDGAASVPLQIELAFESVVDGLDDLAQWLEVVAAGGFGLAFAGRAEQDEPGPGELVLEVAAVVVIVADDDLPGPQGQVALAEDGQQDLPLVGLRPG